MRWGLLGSPPISLWNRRECGGGLSDIFLFDHVVVVVIHLCDGGGSMLLLLYVGSCDSTPALSALTTGSILVWPHDSVSGEWKRTIDSMMEK